MKALLLILLLSPAQDLDWKLIKEMSGDIPNHPGITVETRAAEIARGEETVKLTLRIDFPEGAPHDLFKDNTPHGFDVSSIARFVFKAEFNCRTLTMKAVRNEGSVYQFNGRKHKSKEPPFNLNSGHIFVNYFCERGAPAPLTAPTLKGKTTRGI